MRRPHPIVASLVALSVAWAGVVCACAVSAHAEPESTHAHHVHQVHGAHHGHDSTSATPDAHCAHPDCEGDCGINVFTPERDSSGQLAKKTLDDGALPAAWVANVPVKRIPSLHAPPPASPRVAETPVRRFDILLN